MNAQSDKTRSHPGRAALAFAALAFAPAFALAQAVPAPGPTAAPSKEETVKLEAFTVTGSNIKRLETEKVLPVSIISRDSIEVRDAQTPVDLLVALPQVVNVPVNEASTAGAGARGDNSGISLRGLSSGSTLILLNGRRLAPHPISQAESAVPALSVNVAQLPNRGLERLEVLRDGASAIYGSDAVAGVVNFITQKNFRGSELTLRYGGAQRGAGDEWRATVLFGKDFAEGKGRFTTTFDVYHRTGIFLRDRDFSAEADLTARAPAPFDNYNTNTSFFNRSANSLYGSYTVGTLSANGTFTGVRPAGVPASLTSATGAVFFVPNGSGGATFKTTTPARVGVERDYYYNINSEQVVQPRSTRYNWFGSAEYDLSKNITAFADASYYRAKSTTYRDTESYSSGTDAALIVPANSPWNPFGTRFWSTTGAPNADGTPRLTGTPSPVRVLTKRFGEFGSRAAKIDTEVYRGLAGLRGRLGGSWTWETAALYTAGHTTDVESPTSRESLLIAAVNQTDPAKAFNPFGYNFAVQNGALAITTPYKNPASVVSTFQQPFLRDGKTSVGSVDFRAAGEVLQLWGGNAISVATGAEWRHETYDDTRPPFAGLNPAGSGLDPTDNDFIALSPNSDTHATRNLWGGYAEVAVPLVGNKFRLPLVQSFELNGSWRVERYSDFGTARKPKAGFTWRVAPWLLARASYNEGFRAPNLAQLFTGELVRATASTDTYRSSVTLLPSDGNVTRLEKRSGNSNLRPEQSRGKSAGIVVEVPKVKGLSFSIDYWEINQLGLIDNTTAIADDLDALNAATQAALAAGQRIDQIDLGSGTANYKGNVDVVRLPVTQQDRDLFAAYNARVAPGNQRAVVGAIQFTRQTYFNKARQFVNGFDYGVNWLFPQTRVGRFTLASEWSRYNTFFNYPSATAARDVRLWENGAAKWRGNLSLSWRRQNWGAGVSAYYIGSFQDTGATTTTATYDSLGAPSYISRVFDTGAIRYRYIVRDSLSFNSFVSYSYRGQRGQWLADTSVRLGVVNLTNVEPPLSSGSRGYESTVYTTLARGRTWSVQVTKKL